MDCSASLDEERPFDSASVLEHRLRLAVNRLKWSPARIVAFRAGYADALQGRADQARMQRHDGVNDGYLEHSLTPADRDSLGYRDGVEAVAALSLAVADYSRDPNELQEIAWYWADNGDNDFDIDEATWSSTTAEDLSIFLRVMSREKWIEWFVEEHVAAIADGRPGYADLLIQDIHEAIVYISYEDGRIDVWDGWHRIGAAMLKGAGQVPAIKGVPAPSPAPMIR